MFERNVSASPKRQLDMQFIFSRRDIQERIERLSKILREDQVSALINRLNKPDKNRLPAMWEVVVLGALSHEGELEHEACLPSGKRPDIDLSHISSSGQPLRIIGDILTVSDAGLHEQNPVDLLFEYGPKLAKKFGLGQSSLSFRIEGGRDGKYGDGRMRLALPKRGQLIELLHGEVTAWLREVSKQPGKHCVFRPKNTEIGLTITYDPTAKTQSGSYLSYDVAASLEKNPIYKALRDKKDQLSGAQEGAIKLLIVCDGGSSLLRSGSTFRAPGNYGVLQIVDHFLTKHSGVDAVLLIAVEEKHSFLPPRISRSLKLDLRVTAAHRGPPISAQCGVLDALLSRAAARLPQPQFSAYNAAKWCLNPGTGRSRMGDYRISYEGSKRMVEISARGLMELLAGAVSLEEFEQAHRWGLSGGHVNPFNAALEDGRSLACVGVQKREGVDDDWIRFEFGEVDAAISPFFLPKVKKDSSP